jgi:hypothetical protein
LIALSAAQAVGAVADQQQLLVDPFVPGFSIGGATEQVLAQTVTVGIGGPLAAVRLPVSCTSGSLLLQVQGVTAGAPAGVVLASQIFSAAFFPPSSPDVEFRTLSIPSPVEFAVGDRFALVLRSSGTCAVAAGPSGDPYSRGAAFFQDREMPPGSWSALGARGDLPFQTLVGTAADGGLPATADEGATGFVSVRCFLDALWP